MTLTAEQSSNKAKYEAAPTAEIVDIVRTAMDQGCIRPCHVYDAVDELICRIQALENRPKRNCDVGSVDEQLARFRKFCKKGSRDNFEATAYCAYECPCGNNYDCKLAWAQMPYEEGGDK